MKQVLAALVAAFAMSTIASAAERTEIQQEAQQKPVKMVKLTKQQLAKITAGAISQVNGGGNVPNGQANGVPASNPAGKQPPGQNK